MSETDRLIGLLLFAVIGGGGSAAIIALWMARVPGAREAAHDLHEAVVGLKDAIRDAWSPVLMPVIDWLARRLRDE